MRRNKKRGIRTNKTIKNCHCCIDFCQTCKSTCKMWVSNYNHPENIAPHHIESYGSFIAKRKLYYYGVGTLEPGGKLFPKILRGHRRRNSYLKSERMRPNKVYPRNNKKERIRVDINDQVLLYNLAKYSEDKIKHAIKLY